jgi:hypothetical protein
MLHYRNHDINTRRHDWIPGWKLTGEQTENMTGGEVGSNMTGMGNMTGAKTYYITATMACTPEAITNMTEAQAGNMTENMT